jgi:hypothetical protein
MNSKHIWIFLISLALLAIPVAACSDGLSYVGFTIMQQNYTTIPGFIWYEPAVNAVIIATPTEQYVEPWITDLLKENNQPTSELHAQLGITDEQGHVGIPLYSVLEYNLTVMRENKPDKHFLIIPSENEYVLYLGD